MHTNENGRMETGRKGGGGDEGRGFDEGAHILYGRLAPSLRHDNVTSVSSRITCTVRLRYVVTAHAPAAPAQPSLLVYLSAGSPRASATEATLIASVCGLASPGTKDSRT